MCLVPPLTVQPLGLFAINTKCTDRPLWEMLALTINTDPSLISMGCHPVQMQRKVRSPGERLCVRLQVGILGITGNRTTEVQYVYDGPFFKKIGGSFV